MKNSLVQTNKKSIKERKISEIAFITQADRVNNILKNIS